jgi:tRNA threonylcarbamoyladenosine biosynthesis protein TsaB
MKILAADTSSAVASAAISDEGRLLGEYILMDGRMHSQKLMPMIDSLLANLQLKIEEISLYAASSGPGSFTGLRIGITTMKALAYAMEKPAIGIPTLDSLAYNVSPSNEVPQSDSLVCPVIDARNRQVFTAIYDCHVSEYPVRVSEYMGISVEELASILACKNRNIIFTGDAAESYSRFFQKELSGHCSIAAKGLLMQKASSASVLAWMMSKKGKMPDCMELIPFYLRKPQAEREYDEKRSRTGIK